MDAPEPRPELSCPEFVIVRFFPFPAELLWNAWTDAARLRRWYGPGNSENSYASIHLSVGGIYLANMKCETRTLWVTGRYLIIEPGRRLVMQDHFSDKHGHMLTPQQAGMKGDWKNELTISLEFSEEAGSSRLLLKHQGVPTEFHVRYMAGWEESLDKLQVFLERGRM